MEEVKMVEQLLLLSFICLIEFLYDHSWFNLPMWNLFIAKRLLNLEKVPHYRGNKLLWLFHITTTHPATAKVHPKSYMHIQAES